MASAVAHGPTGGPAQPSALSSAFPAALGGAPIDPSFDADIVACIQRDHQAFRDVQRSIEAAALLSHREKMSCVYDLVRLIVRHSMAEEVVLYPLARQTLGGPSATAADLDFHKRLRAELAALSSCSPFDASLDAKLARMWRTLEAHMDEEEKELLPAIARATTRARRVAAGRTFAAARLLAPTRPHLAAPMTPPLNLAASAIAGPLDWLADMWRFNCSPPL